MTDPILFWNDVFLQATRLRGGPPGPPVRVAAMLHAAQSDAVTLIGGGLAPQTYLSTLGGIVVPPGASAEAAATAAAHHVLSAPDATSPTGSTPWFAGQKAYIDDALAQALELLTGSPAAISDGQAVGMAVAEAMLAERASDGPAHDPAYTPGGMPGDWRPTSPVDPAVPNSGQPATPHWGTLKPFTMTAGDQFRPPLPAGYETKTALLQSVEYASQMAEVQRLGRADSTVRTDEQTQIALFWANDLDGTSKPPGQLFTLTQIVSRDRALTFGENARLFALVALALADASILAWDAKYDTDIDLWRPETAIQRAGGDGNPITVADPDWQPLSPGYGGGRFTPPFPAYVSGHATFGATHAGVLRNFFETDNVTFTLDTEDPHALAQYGPKVERTFNSFSSAALENGRSRVYLGVHFQWDADEAYVAGTNLADFVSEKYKDWPSTR